MIRFVLIDNNFGNKSTNKGSKSGDTPKKRKCGICGQEGHHRNVTVRML